MGQSVPHCTQKQAGEESNGGFHPPKTPAQGMVSRGWAVNPLLAAPPEDRPCHNPCSPGKVSTIWFHLWYLLHPRELCRGLCTPPKHSMHLPDLNQPWTWIPRVNTRTARTQRKFQLIALERTAVANADAAFTLVQYSQRESSLLTSLCTVPSPVQQS